MKIYVTDPLIGEVTTFIEYIFLETKDEGTEWSEEDQEEEATREETMDILLRIQEILNSIYVSAITCSKEDEEWGFQIPSMSQEFREKIAVEYSPEDDD